MQSTFQQFRNLSEPIGTFERLFHAALQSLVPDLGDAPWYVREREVVNLFVFRHLVPQFQAEKLDISQIGIEVPVQVIPESAEGKPAVYADIVVWPHIKATLWRTCKPLARIEWKNVSCRQRSACNLERQHREDVDHLNLNWKLASANYAVITARQGGNVAVRCTRIVDGKPEEFMSPIPSCDGAGDENKVKGPYRPTILRPQTCPDCILRSRAATAV